MTNPTPNPSDSADEPLATKVRICLYATGKFNNSIQEQFEEVEQVTAAILAAFTAELRAIVPEKRSESVVSNFVIKKAQREGYNAAIDAVERKAGERGLL